MSRILVTYATMAGSTAEVAQAVADEVARCGFQVEVLPLNQVTGLAAYDGVVVGAPMIMGWHRDARHFLRKHRADFQRIPLAVFLLAMSLTHTEELESGSADGAPVFVDDTLPKPPHNAGRLSFRERYATLGNYLRPIFGALRPLKPASIGVFGGRLEFGRLKWWAMLFVLLVIQAAPGEKRNWAQIRAWASGLPAAFKLAP